MRIELRPMQPVFIQVNPDGDVWYPSIIDDLREGEWVSVGVPMSGGGEVPVRPGVPIHIELALPDGLRRFVAAVRERRGGAGTAPTLVLDWPRDVQKIQRRDNVRVDAAFPARIRLRGAGATDAEPISGLTQDLSAGGTQVRVPEQLPDLSTIELTLELPAGERTCGARVVRGGELPQARGELRYWLALTFTDMEPALRREITRLVFDLQRELMRRGAL